ncbi:MAG: hypothetical protein U0353_25455 [Sandaracinus sp.]
MSASSHTRAGSLLGHLTRLARLGLALALGLVLGSVAEPLAQGLGAAILRGAHGEPLVSLTRSAHAQTPPAVELFVDGIFGHDAFLSGGYTTIVVRATNRTASALRGELHVQTRTWDHVVSVHRVPLDLPAREGRVATLTLPAFDDGLTFDVTYQADGGTLGTANTALSYAGSARPIIVLDDPPRLRAPLVGTRVSLYDTSAYYGSAREVEVPIGVTSSDPRSGDLLLPDSAAGWSNVLLAVGTVPALGRAGEPELAALEAWVRAGGHLVVMPTRDADLDHAFVRRTVGSLGRASDQPAPFASLGVTEAPLACPASATREVFGCQVRVGFGVVWVTDVDLSDARLVNRPEVQEIFQAMARSVAAADDRVHPYLSFARGADRPLEPWMSGPNVAAVRSALDPNEGYRPALVLVGVVLLAYVLLVGPVNFTIVERRKQPTLALVTTPILALLCVMATFFVGYVGKGVLMRYRRIALVDVVDGSPTGAGRTYTGLFYTRPTGADVELSPGAVAMRIGSGNDGPTIREGGDHRTLESMRAGLWETAFVRQDDTPSLGGPVRFELDGSRIARVRNDSTLTLRAAFMTDLAGGVYQLPEIAPGTSVDVPTAPTSFLAVGDRPSADYWTGADAFLGTLGYRSDAREAVMAMMAMSTEAPSAGVLPVLYARIDPEAPPDASPTFDAELDVRILRVVPSMQGSALYVPTLTAAIQRAASEGSPPIGATSAPGGAAAGQQTGGAP